MYYTPVTLFNPDGTCHQDYTSKMTNGNMSDKYESPKLADGTRHQDYTSKMAHLSDKYRSPKLADAINLALNAWFHACYPNGPFQGHHLCLPQLYALFRDTKLVKVEPPFSDSFLVVASLSIRGEIAVYLKFTHV